MRQPRFGDEIGAHLELETELSVAKVKGNAFVCQAYMSQCVGRTFGKGATCPHAEVG